MDLGRFSVSLPVADLEKSLAFYQAFGFRMVADEREKNYVILEHGEARVGLFAGMFDKPMLTWNPPGDMEAVHAAIREAGAEVGDLQPGYGEGGLFFTAKDPDGHDLLVDFFGTPPADD